MNFVHRPYQKGETIAALATAVGEGGIAIIRISGDEAIAVADAIFSKKVSSFKSHTVHHGFVTDGKKRIDEALLIVMRAPRSYTGEETVEIQCHGGRLAATAVLEAALQHGARPAEPGEFTCRAFLNGKLDLAQAEAVQELIAAKSRAGFASAQNHLEGALSKEILLFQRELTQIAAILEAWVDFPEEGLEFATKEEMIADIDALLQRMRHLWQTFEEGQRLSSGISLTLVGAPNAGKSSLLNALLRKERAIVTKIAGTTRDLVQEEFVLDGVLFHITDTAGIRKSEDLVEREGIRRSFEAMERSDITLLVVDATNPDLLECEPTFTVWNKCDLASVPKGELAISAKEGEGLAELKRRLLECVKNVQPSDLVLTHKRHYVALGESIEALLRLREGLLGSLSPEFLNQDAREALKQLGLIIGQDVSEEILSSIFSTFCVGK
ncbi:MAG: tRNA uridine-5-carboxymethylaminomethyl(34) synthesis GTPase MnmE [Chlamydiae bacterium]|nr:tRNA uridine-5-carboxymethylaminomethyl(34) synthesis GTPase MnmE [Chlamydiota bacterium]